ncbi:MAG: amidohydrolase [Campylobacter sp.]|nr:amidohydrolase [Campylobacter sp.]
MQNLKKLIAEFENEIIQHRRHIHQNPELSNFELQTSAYICACLDKMQIPYKKIAKTGVVGFIKGKKGNKKIAFRADIDALPINEENTFEFKSKIKNCMHACGHDMHTAILLGTAKILKHYEKSLKGEVLLIFQPAEEASPKGGSRSIIESGILKDVSLIYGLHLWPEAKAGKIFSKKGALMAASDFVKIHIKGKASHAAEPQKGVDSLLAASHWISSIQNILAREIEIFEPRILTFGKMNSGTRYNVLAENTILEGTCRTFNPQIRKLVKEKIKTSLKANDILFKTQSTLEYKEGYNALINNDEALEFAKNAAEKYGLKIEDANKASMCAEDYSFYLDYCKGAFFWLGTGYKHCAPLHHPLFNPDESVMKIGVLLFSALALEFLM